MRYCCALAALACAIGICSASASTPEAPAPVPSVLSVEDCEVRGSALVCRGAGGVEFAIPKEMLRGLRKRQEEHGEEGHVHEEGDEHAHEEEEHAHEEGEEHAHEEEEQEQAHGEEGHVHEEGDEHDHSEETATSASATTKKKNCHSHAGVEHCEEENTEELLALCAIRKKTYKMPLRIGAIFIVLIGSLLSVFLPISLNAFAHIATTSTTFIAIKQFGTGVIISTAFVHLLTHAFLMFENKCMTWDLYESTAAAICMGGIFFSFGVEYIGNRIIRARNKHVASSRAASDSEASSTTASDSTPSIPSAVGHTSGAHVHKHGAHAHDHAHPTKPVLPALTPTPTTMGCGGDTASLHSTANDKLAVMVMESGVIFHSILIGITLIVSDDTTFNTLLIVIVFHQAFEGLALGARISALPEPETSLRLKMLLAGAFTLITPIGMSIGLGVLNTFNGNDPKTIFAISFLNAFSAGILVYVGVVEMLAHDWIVGELKEGAVGKTVIAGASLLAGGALMSLLGNWI